MDIGGFDRLVLVQQPGQGQDAFGQPVDAPLEVCRAWANIRHPSGAEAIRGGAPTSVVQSSIRVWGYSNDTDAVMDIACGWDLEEPWDREHVEKLITRYLGSARAIIDRFVAENSGAVLGN